MLNRNNKSVQSDTEFGIQDDLLDLTDADFSLSNDSAAVILCAMIQNAKRAERIEEQRKEIARRKEKFEILLKWYTSCTIDGKPVNIELSQQEKKELWSKVDDPVYKAVSDAGLFKKPEVPNEDRNFFHILRRNFK